MIPVSFSDHKVKQNRDFLLFNLCRKQKEKCSKGPLFLRAAWHNWPWTVLFCFLNAKCKGSYEHNALAATVPESLQPIGCSSGMEPSILEQNMDLSEYWFMVFHRGKRKGQWSLFIYVLLYLFGPFIVSRQLYLLIKFICHLSHGSRQLSEPLFMGSASIGS